MTGAPPTCWCGGVLDAAIGPYYRRCAACGSAVRVPRPAHAHFGVSDDDRDFYGRRYWTDYAVSRKLPDIASRSRADLAERCLFWLERVLEVTSPPGRFLEIGCGHGAFVRLMHEVGFDAVGTELSPWVAGFARRAFDIQVAEGPIERLALRPGFRAIAAFDVLEHLEDPLATIAAAAALLDPDGVLVIQTPWYRDDGPDWAMFQEDEHVHLFSAPAMRLLLERAGFLDVLVRPSLFAYDMWVVASRGRVALRPPRDGARAGWRMPTAFAALLDLRQREGAAADALRIIESDRAARLAQVEELTERLAKLMRDLPVVEEDRAERLEQLREVTRRLAEVEADRAARLGQIEELTARLGEVEGDRAARLGQIEELTARLGEVEGDRAARLGQIEELTARLGEVEGDRAARLGQIEELTARLGEVEGDRAARLGQIEELTARLGEVEGDRAARLGQIEELTRLLQELTRRLEASQADLEGQLEATRGLERRLQAIEQTGVWRSYARWRKLAGRPIP